MLALELIPHYAIPIILFISAFPIRYASYLQIAFHAFIAFAFLICPSCFLSPLVTGKLDDLHVLLQRYAAVFHIGYAYFVFYAPRADRSASFARGLSALFLLLAQAFTAYRLHETNARGVRLNEQFLIVNLALNGIWAVVELYHFVFDRRGHPEEIDAMCYRTRRWIEGKETHSTDNLLYLDSALALLYALTHFAYPHQILKVIIKSENLFDGAHILLTRQFGVYMLASALTSLLAIHFTVKNQKTYIISRIMMHIGIFALNVLGHWSVKVFSSNHITPFMLSGFYITFLMSLFYRLQRSGDIVLKSESVTITRKAKNT